MVPSKEVRRKTKKRTQYAALCYRQDSKGALEFLLITSRGRGRWICPKGWPMAKVKPHKAAAVEALEEAGVVGKVHRRAIGRFTYAFHDGAGDEAFVFPLQVTGRVKNFKEKGERKVKWFSRKKALARISEPKLKKLMKAFDPQQLAG